MLKNMTVEELMRELSVYPKDMEVVIIADAEYEEQKGIDMGINENRLIIHVGKEQYVPLI